MREGKPNRGRAGRGYGRVPDALIDYQPSLLGQAIDFYSCFISYNHTDRSCARKTPPIDGASCPRCCGHRSGAFPGHHGAGHDLTDGLKAEQVIGEWIGFYNTERPHSALAGQTPAEAYAGLPSMPVTFPAAFAATSLSAGAESSVKR